MKTIVLGDIHGLTIWKDIVDLHPDADRIIFIGDYFDSFHVPGLEQLNNFEQICKFKRESEKQVIMLIGNHDHHYFPEVGSSGTSGYQPKMKVAFENAIRENRDLLQMSFIDENTYIYSHAGISKKWCLRNNIDITDPNQMVFMVNELFNTQPKKFCFYFDDFSGKGDHVLQSPIWIRPDALWKSKIQNLQFVGHTVQNAIQYDKSKRRGFFLIDTLETSQEYIVVINGDIQINQV